MAKGERKTANAIKELAPDARVVTIDGKSVMIPSTVAENAMLNVVMAARGRAMIENALKNWSDRGEEPNPKELRDIAAAMKEIADLSTACIRDLMGSGAETKGAAKFVDAVGAVPDIIDFSTLKKVNGKPPEAGQEPPVPATAGEGQNAEKDRHASSG